jgi:hypothetical protein
LVVPAALAGVQAGRGRRVPGQPGTDLCANVRARLSMPR